MTIYMCNVLSSMQCLTMHVSFGEHTCVSDRPAFLGVGSLGAGKSAAAAGASGGGNAA